MKNFSEAMLATINATNEDECEAYVRQLVCAAHGGVSENGIEIAGALKRLDTDSGLNLFSDMRFGRKFDEIHLRNGNTDLGKMPDEILVTQLNNINFSSSWSTNAARLRATLDIIQSWTGMQQANDLTTALERVKKFLKESKKVEQTAKRLLLEKIDSSIDHVNKQLVPA